MLRKLLKYDIKEFIKYLSIFYGLSLFFALSTRILNIVNQTVFIKILYQISIGAMFSMLASSLINSLTRCWVRFSSSLFKDEGYLLHTLPVSKGEIYESKFLQALFGLLMTFIVVLLCLFIAFYSKENWKVLLTFLDGINLKIGISGLSLIAFLVFILFLELFNILQIGFLGTIIGNKYNNSKLLKTFIWTFIIYFISQLFVVVSIVVLGLFNRDILSIFTSNSFDYNVIKTIGIFSMFVYSFIIVVINILCVKYLNEGVDLD